MKVLHIISQYTVSPVYRELIKNISKNKEIQQEIYIPMRSNELVGKYKLENCPNNVNYIFSVIYNKFDRLIYYTRLKKEFKDLEKKIELKKVNYVHAHTLFADGGLAYKLKKKFGIHYIVAVRSTDIRGYLRRMPHCRIFMNAIIKEADKVIFISPSMKQEMEKYMTHKGIKILNQKSIIKPNGIVDYWHENINRAKNIAKNTKNLNLIQVSELDNNKNLYATINVIEILNKNGINTKLNVIGAGRKEEEYKKIVKEKKLEDKITFKGYIKDKDMLKELYRESDIFIMLSKRETFGLVYIEALSQGLPILYTKGTGVYGFFKEGQVGYALDLNKLGEVTKKVKEILQRYTEISKEAIKQSKNFQWQIIAKDYIKLYKEE